MVSLNLTEEERTFWQKVLIRATHDKLGQPYLSYVLFSLIPVNVSGEKTKTMGVDKQGRVYVDFDHFMNGFENPAEGLADATKVLNHEPWHLLRNHHNRFDEMPAFDNKNRPRDGKIWNYAGDLTINQDIRPLVPDWGVHVGEAGMFEKFPKNLTTEEYYEKIAAMLPERCPDCGAPQKADKNKKSEDKADKSDKSDGSNSESGEPDDSGKSQQSGDSESGEGDSEGSGDSSDGNGNSDSGEGEGGAGNGSGNSPGTCGTCGESNQPGAAAGQCGSGAGNANGYELGEDAPGLTEHEIDGLARLTAEEIRKQEQSAPGSTPGGMKLWADEVLAPPTIDWRTVLRGEIRSSISWKQGKMDYNRSRRNRRSPVPNIIVPALQSPKARITVGVDKSGSNMHNLGVVLSNVVQISKQGGVRGRELSAFTVDTRASQTRFVPNPMDLFKDVKGGGGTDMCVAFDVFADLAKQKKTDICILATDLETGWPPQPPATPNVRYIVLGVMNTNDRNSHYQKAAEKALEGWAKLVCVYPDEI